jgi:hypothetical protein
MEIIVETYIAQGEQSSAKLRVRPVAGQGFDTSLKVRCSRSMREQFPPGSYFRMAVYQNSREGGPPFLESARKASWEHVTPEEAERFIAKQFGHKLGLSKP